MSDETDSSAISAAVDRATSAPNPATQARLSVSNVVGSNPTFEAELQKVSKATGVPIDTARAFPDEAKNQAALQAMDFDKLARDYPTATQFLADQSNAAVAHKDVGTLTSLEDFASAFIDPWQAKLRKSNIDQSQVMTGAQFSTNVNAIKAANPSITFDEARMLAAQGTTVDNVNPLMGNSTRPNATAGNLATGLWTSLKEGYLKADANYGRAISDVLGLDEGSRLFKQKADQSDSRLFLNSPEPQNWGTRAVYGGFQSLAQQVPGLAVSMVTGNPAPSLAQIFFTSSGGAYGKYKDRGATTGEALLGSGIEGALEVGTELLPMSVVVNKLGKVGFGEFAKDFFGKELIGEEINTILSNATDTAIANPTKTWTQYFAELPADMTETAIQTLVQSGLLASASHGLSHTVMKSKADGYKAQSAIALAEALTNMQKTAEASDIITHSKDTLQTYMQGLADKGVPNIHVDSAKLAEAGVDMEALALAVPSVAAQLDQVKTGGDLVIPTGELLANTIGTEFSQPLIDNARAGADAMSKVEAEEHMKTEGAKMAQDIQRVLDEKQNDDVFQTSKQVVQDKLAADLDGIGRQTAAVNQKIATWFANFYAAQAAKVGMTPEAFATKYQLGFSDKSNPTAQYDQKTIAQGRIMRTVNELVAAADSQKTWKDWYSRHEATLVSMFGSDSDLFQKILSATSQATGVKGNVTLALKAYDQLHAGLPFEGYLPAVIKNLERIKNEEALAGAKISQYGEANDGNTEAIAVDRHIAMLFFNTKTPNRAQIESAKERIRKIADRLGWEPRQVQAALWAFNQVRLGTDPTKVESYDKILEARADFISVLRSKHGRGEGGGVQAGSSNVEGDASGGTYAQSANQLSSDILDAGGQLRDVAQLDQLVDSKLIPTITMQDMVGMSIFATIADRTAAAALFTGIDSSQIQMAVPLLGGPFFPLRQSNFNKIVWANRGKGVTSQKAAKLKAGANYMLVVMGDANMHQSNSTVAAAFMGTLEAWARDGRISQEGIEALGTMVRETGAQAVDAFKAKLEKATAAFDAATTEEEKDKAKKAQDLAKKAIGQNQYLENFPGFDNPEIMHAYMDGISFDARKRILDLMGGKAAQDLGAPPMQMILDATREPSLAGHRWGDGVILLEVDQENHQVDLGTEGTQAHPDFPVGIRGRVVGKLNKAVNWELLWQDWLKENSDKASPRRAFELAKPVVNVTQDLVDRIGPINQENIDGARQARLAADFAAGNWRTSDNAVNKGGISPQEFVDAIQASTAKDTLTPYTIQEVTAGIKDGSMKLYQLGDGQIFFMLKTEGTTKLLASVVNNEQGARGIGGPAVVLKAIQEGATDLDCFAVKSEKFPHGFLPSLYSAFGFKADHSRADPYDPQYFAGLKEADAVKYWKQSTPRFDPKNGMPDLVYMSWKGSEDERAGIVDRYLRTGFEGLHSAGAGQFDGSTMQGLRDSSGESSSGQGSATGDGDGSGGDQGAAAGASVSSRARLTVQGIANLTDNELANLGITPKDRSDVRRALGHSDYAQGERGQISFANDITQQASIISLMKNGDLSTFIHEGGHFFLEVQADLANRIQAKINAGETVSDGEQSIIDDFAKVLGWFGVKATPEMDAMDTWASMSADEKRPYHEQFARGWEAYAFEGKSPSLELQGIFQTFRSWLISVYKNLLKSVSASNTDIGNALNVKLDADVRGVFDRMIATTQQIQEAEAVRSMNPMFNSAEDAGMDIEAWKAYHDMAMKATQNAIDELQSKGLKDMQWLSNAKDKILRKLQRQHKELRLEIARQERAKVMAQPVYQAWAFLTSKAGDQAKAGETDLENSDLGTAAGKLRTQVLRDKYGIADDAVWRKLSTLRMTSDENGLHPDLVAERFGFSSGDEMVHALSAAEDPKVLVQQQTDQRMLEEHGDLATPEALERAADAAIHNEARARFVATELRALQHAMAVKEKKEGARSSVDLLAAAAKEYAESLIAKLRVRDINPAKYAAAETRAANAAAKSKGDLPKAAEYKRNQLINMQAAKQAYAALEEIKAAVAYLKKFDKASTRQSIPKGYLDQIDALLEKYDLRQRSITSIDRTTSLRTWVQSQLQAGNIPNISESLLSSSARVAYLDEITSRNEDGDLTYTDDEERIKLLADYIERSQKTSFKEMTVEEMRGLRDTVKQMEHLGRLKNKMLTARDGRTYEEIKKSLIEALVMNAKEEGKNTRTDNTWIGRRLDGLARFGVAHIKPATWMRIFDGGQDGGAWWNTITRPANERASFESDRRAKATEALMKALGPVLKNVEFMDKVGKGVFFPALNTSLNWEERFAILCNYGNESNLQRLMGGGIAGVTKTLSVGQIQAVLKTMSAAEFNAAQAIWDHFESYRPEIASKELRVNGVEPEWIAARPFTIKSADGVTMVMRGGYFPVKFDPKTSLKAEQHASSEDAKNAMKAAYSVATTQRSFTKARVEEVHGRPLLLNLNGLYSGVNDVIHDLAWHEWVIDMNRLMRSTSVDEAIRDHYGANVKRELTKWRDDIVAGTRKLDHGIENAVGWARKFASASALTFNVVSALMQPLGVTQSFARVGTKWVASGIAQYIASPVDSTTMVQGKSTFMANRTRTMWRDVNELRNRIGGQTTGRELMGRYGYFLTMHLQMMVDVPTWIGAYEKAIHGNSNESTAIALADQAVKDSQGGGEEVDQSGITRGGPMVKLFTAFYDFMNTQANLLYLGAKTKDKGKAFMDFVMIGVATPILGAMLRDALISGDSGDWDDWDKAIKRMITEGMTNLIGMVAFGREFSQAAKALIGEDKGMGYSGPAGLRLIPDAYKLMQQIHQGQVDDGFRKAFITSLGDVSGIPAVQINRTINGIQALSDGKTSNPMAVVTGYQSPH